MAYVRYRADGSRRRGDFGRGSGISSFGDERLEGGGFERDAHSAQVSHSRNPVPSGDLAGVC